MKKIILFLLLFGGGLALLLYLQEDKVAPIVEPEKPPEDDEQSGPTVTIKVPDEDNPTSEQEITVQTSGPAEFQGLGERDEVSGLWPRLYNFNTTNLLSAEGDTFTADDVRLLLFNPATDLVRAEITATRGYLHLDLDGGQFDISSSEPVRLESVDLTILSGAPIVPIYFRVPTLDWTRIDGAFASQDRVVLDSPGVKAEGTGMRIVTSEGRESITLMRDGSMSFELEGDQSARLDALGLSPLVLSRSTAGGIDNVRLTVDDGARLALANGNVLNAQSLTVLGRRVLTTDATGKETGEFVLSSVNALGQVSVIGENGTLYGSEATLEFDEAGEAQLLTVSGNPRADLTLKTSESTTAQASLDGVGPLRVVLGAKDRFEFAGPAVLSWPEEDLVVSAKEWIRGTYDETTEHAVIEAQGAVKVTHIDGELEGPSLELTYSKPEAGVSLARVEVQGPSRFEGRDEMGRVAIVNATGPLTARTRRVEGSEADEFFLERAEGVTATLETPVENERNFTATCGVLREVDFDKRTFIAESGVTYEIDGARGVGDRIVGISEDEFELYGSTAKPARVHLIGGEGALASVDSVVAESAYLHVTPLRIEGSDGVEIVMARNARELKATAKDITFEWLAEESTAGEPRPYRLTANGIERAGMRDEGEEVLLTCDKLIVEGVIGEELGPFELEATGAVRVEAAGKRRELSSDIGGTSSLVGMGEKFTWSVTAKDLASADDAENWSAGRGRLSTGRGKRVRSLGNLAGERLPYEMSADWIEFDSQEVRAANPLLRIDSTNLPTSQGPGSADGSQVFEVAAKNLTATRNVVRLDTDVHLTGESQGRYSWSLDSDEVEIRLDLDAKPDTSPNASPVPSALESVVAQGNLTVVFNEQLRGTGDRMVATNDQLRLEGRRAHLETAAYAWESRWIEFSFTDEIVTTGRGLIVPRTDDPNQGWKIDYESLQPFQEGEVTVLALRNVQVTQNQKTLRSNWALFWIDNEERAKASNPLVSSENTLRTEQIERRETPQDPPAVRSQLAPFRGMWDSSLARILNEVYLEGDVEYLVGTDRLIRAEAIYVDLVERHSWIQTADVLARTPETKGETLRIKAEWIRHTENGSLRAEEATVTSCSHDVPHYVIEVANLRMDPIEDPEEENLYHISLQKNSLRFQNGMRIPLPTTSVDTDENGRLDPRTLTVAGFRVPNVTLGSSAKFGTTVGTTFSRNFGRIGERISGASERLLRLKPDSVRGNWNYNATWFGSRGLLLGLGFEVSDNDRFWLRAQADGIPDRRRDRGLVRTPKADRSTFRGWYRARGRYTLDVDEWIELRFTRQSDAGVQAEFFEREFVAYEERETYLQWRKADDQFFYSATVEAPPSSTFTDIQELPSIMLQRGSTPLMNIGKTPLLYEATADLEYLNRHSGSQEIPYADGFNGPTVARLDTRHRFTAPFQLGDSNARVTPFIEGRATAWNESQTGLDDPLRAGLSGGGAISMALWKRASGGRMHTIAPRIGSRVTMGVDQSGGQPIFFDEVENPLQGHFIDAGVRSIWTGPDPNRYVDLDISATHASDVPADVNGWALATYALLRNYLAGMPVAVLHDGRYDLDDSFTDYSRTYFGLKPWENVELGTGYNSGRGPDTERLYESASVSARYKATPKWDLEVRQVFNLDGAEDLATSFLIRRFGHDMLFELEFNKRAGEGTGFSIGFRPRIGWRRSTLGLFSDD